ncbi:MAG: branched-chain amino acid ABC transporter permease [Pseudomonadales bacterium]
MEVIQILISGVSQGCVYGLIAMGFVLIYKATEMVNFAQGELMMLGAYFAYTFINILGMGYLPGFIATVLSMALVGVILERGVLRPMIGEPPFAVLMITIGLGFILRAFAGAVWGTETKTLSNPFTGNVARFGELAVGYENLAIIAGTIILCITFYLFFRFTRLGIAMQAASQNQLAAYYVGIPVKWIYSLVWALSASLAAVAGVLVAPVSLLEPVMGFIGIKAFCAAIVGGFGSLPGAIVGGLIVGIAEQFANLYLPPGIAATTAYIILLVMLFIRPQGLFANLQQKKV